MKIVKQEAHLLNTSEMTQYQIIERVGRTCYKSEDKITDDSAKKFVASLVKSGHHAMIEFGYIYLKITDIDFCEWFENVKNDRIHMIGQYVVGNMRTFYDLYKGLLDDKWMLYPGYEYQEEFMDLIHILSIKYPEVYKDLYDQIHEKFESWFDDSDTISPDEVSYPFIIMEPEEFYKDFERSGYMPALKKYIMPHIVMFTTNRGVSHELCRHRECVSFAMESTRYCNYSKGKFGSEITVIEPMFEPGSDKYQIWYDGCLRDEEDYFKLLNLGATPQEARGKLPNDLKADLWMGAFEDEWQHIINLRYHGTTGAPHPQCKDLIGLVYPQLVEASKRRLK
jgi:thymidylate synthase (FAD)